MAYTKGMAAADRSRERREQLSGIFGPDWPKWRGAIMRIALADEPPFVARFDDVKVGSSVGRAPAERTAMLTELDEALRPVKQRALPWPPDGEVRVLRTP